MAKIQTGSLDSSALVLYHPPSPIYSLGLSQFYKQGREGQEFKIIFQ